MTRWQRYGIARIALTTDDLDRDVGKLKAAGVEFLSEPVSLSPESANSVRFVWLKDPDGTVLQPVENMTRPQLDSH